MAELRTEDAVLHVELEGDGDPVSVFAHGLTSSCLELAQLTPFVPGTKVRFCFRGHGHSSSPESGYRFGDFARDVLAVAETYGADVALGTSLGAGAISHLVAYHDPNRFRKLIFLLPAGLDRPLRYKERLLRMAALVDGKSREDAVEALLSDPTRLVNYAEMPWLREFDQRLLRALNPVGVPRAIREIVDDWPLRDREDMRRVTAPTLLICREGDEIHPAIVGRILADIMPNAELMLFRDAASMYEAIPSIVTRVSEFLRSDFS
ncbi:MAG: alpha/beta hydrolase [Actinomycetota bacterium]|nr:alpha/beta hydrolase [Actinomycetota bacterium]